MSVWGFKNGNTEEKNPTRLSTYLNVNGLEAVPDNGYGGLLVEK